MKRNLVLFVSVLLFAVVGAAQEKVDLTTPVAKTSTQNYQIASVLLDWGGARIKITLVANNGENLVHEYTGTTATNLMISLNKANLTTRSLNQRIFDRLIADGVIVGTVGGTVQ